jgi:hypothetical protein
MSWILITVIMPRLTSFLEEQAFFAIVVVVMVAFEFTDKQASAVAAHLEPEERMGRVRRRRIQATCCTCKSCTFRNDKTRARDV